MTDAEQDKELADHEDRISKLEIGLGAANMSETALAANFVSLRNLVSQLQLLEQSSGSLNQSSGQIIAKMKKDLDFVQGRLRQRGIL